MNTASSTENYISLGGLLKATPFEEAGRRILFMEASNEDPDYQNEIVLQKALSESSDYYLRHGNIDLSHYSILGAKSGIANFMEFEIGKPIDVQITDKAFVKCELYTGESPMAKNANMVWESLTRQNPPSRWYPSVGGVVLSKSEQIDPVTKKKITVVDKVRWNNIALDRCPVNRTVPEVSAAPVGVFAKSFNGFVIKALEASNCTDTAQLTGGGALGMQSLDGSRAAGAIAAVARMLRTNQLNPKQILPYLLDNGFSTDEAQAIYHHFTTDLQTRENQR
jgi:hypothetical protein